MDQVINTGSFHIEIVLPVRDEAPNGTHSTIIATIPAMTNTITVWNDGLLTLLA
jgi:hypothetical protein